MKRDRLASGWTLAGDTIQWDGGDTGLTILGTAVDFGGGPCPAGYVCLFEHADLGGVMWYSNVRGRYLYLSDPGFNVNSSGTPNPNYCMGKGLGSEHPAAAQNDKASAVYIYNRVALAAGFALAGLAPAAVAAPGPCHKSGLLQPLRFDARGDPGRAA